MKKSKIEKRLPEPQYKKEQKADVTSVRPAIAKPLVIGSQCPPRSYTLRNRETGEIIQEQVKQKPIAELNLIIDRCLNDLTIAIKDFDIDEYDKKTSFSWENDRIVIHMTGEFGLTGYLTLEAFESSRKDPDSKFYRPPHK